MKKKNHPIVKVWNFGEIILWLNKREPRDIRVRIHGFDIKAIELKDGTVYVR